MVFKLFTLLALFPTLVFAVTPPKGSQDCTPEAFQDVYADAQTSVEEAKQTYHDAHRAYYDETDWDYLTGTATAEELPLVLELQETQRKQLKLLKKDIKRAKRVAKSLTNNAEAANRACAAWLEINGPNH